MYAAYNNTTNYSCYYNIRFICTVNQGLFIFEQQHFLQTEAYENIILTLGMVIEEYSLASKH